MSKPEFKVTPIYKNKQEKVEDVLVFGVVYAFMPLAILAIVIILVNALSGQC